MKTVILCGGYGTRIRDVSDHLPKPMIPIGNKPILWHIMKYYAAFGFNDFVLCLGYKGDVIKEFFLNYEAYVHDFTITLGQKQSIDYHRQQMASDWKVTLAETGLTSLTGARVKRIQSYIGSDDCFMLTYGDGVGNIDLKKLLAFHQSHGKMMTVSAVHPAGRFGEIVGDSSGQVIGFNEKPQAASGLISGGFFVLNNDIFRYLDDREDLVFEQEPIQQLVKAGQMMMYEHDGFWQPMDTNREYALLNQLYRDKKAPWVIWE